MGFIMVLVSTKKTRGGRGMKMIELTLVEDGIAKKGTAIVEHRGERRTLRAFQIHKDMVTVDPIAVKYPTGEKVWRGEMTYIISRDEFVQPRCIGMDRRARFNSVTVLGFYDEDTKHKSNHAGNR
jgi:hypothetical protein